MRRVRLAVAVVAVAAMTLGVAAPAGAQEEPEALGFAVDKTQAQPGALVLGKANAADVAEHCVTDLEEFQARFQELDRLLFTPGGGGNVAEFAFRFFDDTNGNGVLDPGEVRFAETHDQLAYRLILVIAVGIMLDFDGTAEDALEQTFVMTFADIATQEPVGERGNFDPGTGEGSVVVPDIEPGLWAVAAACVGPILDDLDALEAGIREGGAFLEEIGAPVPLDTLLDAEIVAFMQEFLDSEAEEFELVVEFLGAIGPNLLEPIVVPDAFGAVLFCILDEQGNCPADEPPPPPPGEPIDGGDDEAGPAQPIVAAPTFTG